MNSEQPATPDVYRAICQVAKAISRDGIAKGKNNEQQGYKFRGIDDVYNAMSMLLAEAGLCILPRMTDRQREERQTAKGGVLFYVTVRAEFDFISAKDASTHTVIMYGEAMDTADKATNKAMSAAYKYACMQAFCIPTEGMPDADATTHEVATNKPKSAPQNRDEAMNLKDTINTAMTALKQKFADAGHPKAFGEVLGSYGYADVSEIPMDYKAAQAVVQGLKLALADLKKTVHA